MYDSKKAKNRGRACRSCLVPLAVALIVSPMSAPTVFGQASSLSGIGLTGAAEGNPPRPLSRPQPSRTEAEVLVESELSMVRTAKPASQELSVEPGTLPLLPKDCPAWIGARPDFSTEVHRLHVGSLLADDEQEVDPLLDEPLMAAVHEYIDTRVLNRPGAAGALRDKVTASYIRKNLINDSSGYVARLNTTGEPMYQKWVSVSITPKQRQQIRSWDREATQRQRLRPIGLGLVSVLGLVALSHLVLRSGRSGVR